MRRVRYGVSGTINTNGQQLGARDAWPSMPEPAIDCLSSSMHRPKHVRTSYSDRGQR
jgi:hypothetical protein